jgi:hypothetical protein
MVAPRSATRDTKDAQGLEPRSGLDGICRLSLLFVGGRSIAQTYLVGAEAHESDSDLRIL